MTTLTFCGVTIQCYQASDYGYDVQTKETRLYSGETYANISSTTSIFPRSFLCHTDAFSEITAIAAKIGTFGDLIIDGTTYTNCYIFNLGGIKELIQGSGKCSFSLTFKKADHY